jgi:hypothetical protein
MRRPFAAVGFAIAIAWIATGAAAAPTSFTLQFSGKHVPNTNPALKADLSHEGRFSASAPLCPTGPAVDTKDVELEPLSVMRTHTCDDGTGTFTAFMPTVRGEHGGGGSWKIVEGTGRYATLRGVGTYTGRLVSGDPDRFETIVYATSWQGVVDFDAVAPTLTANATAKKLKKPTRTYSVRAVLDAHEGPVTYSVDFRAGKALLALKSGTAASGRVTTSVRFRAPRGVRTVKVIVTVTDVVGNESSTTLSVGLR